MTHIIRVEGFANGAPCPHAGMYVESGDHEAYGGTGHFEFTPDPRRAMQFATPGEAFEFWRRVPKSKPTRPWDGKPNRPLTAATVTMLTMADALKEAGL